MTALPPPLTAAGPTEVFRNGRRLLYFAGCDYLRLSTHPTIIQAACDASHRYGLGVSASRLTTGNHPLYVDVERQARRFFRSPGAVLTTTGYSANLIAAQTLADRFTHVCIDARAHPSLRDAVPSLNAKVLTFPHRDPAGLARRCRRLPRTARLLLVTDGVFAHDGSIAPLDVYRGILPDSAWLWVDDCHAVGTLGPAGRGTHEFLGLGRVQLVQTATLSKAFGAQGGLILADRAICRDVPNRSVAFAGGTPPPLPLIAAAIASLQLVSSDPARLARLTTNVRAVKARLHAAGHIADITPGPVFGLHPGPAKAPRLKARLVANGILPPWIRYPGGPASGYFRFAISSEHTDEQIDRLLRVLVG